MTRQDKIDLAPPVIFGLLLIIDQVCTSVYVDTNDVSPYFTVGAWFVPLWYFWRICAAHWKGLHK